MIKKLISILGPRVCLFLILGIIVGLVLFTLEISFAYGLQAFLYKIGAINASDLKLPAWIPYSSLYSVLAFLFVIGFTKALFYWVEIYMNGATFEEVKYNLQKRLLNWMFHSDSASSNETVTFFNERANNAGSAVLSLQNLLSQTTESILFTISLFFISVNLTSILPIIILAMAYPLWMANRKIKVTGERLLVEWEKTNSRVLMSIKNHLLMKIYGTQDEEERQSLKSLTGYRKQVLIGHWFLGFKFAAPQLYGVIFICIITPWALNKNQITAGVLMSYLYVFVRLLQSMSKISHATSNLTKHWPQLLDIANHPSSQKKYSETTSGSVIQSIAKPYQFPIGWKLTGVCYSYIESKTQIINNLNLEIKPGKTLVITGPSGVGKSTLLNLLLGQSKPTQGSLEIYFSNGSIDGSRNEITQCRDSLLQSIGYVGAESFLIEGSVYKNLTYGLRYTPNEDDVKNALHQAECHFIYDLPDALQYHLSEQGQGLSAGQKQRLSLARALLRNPKALILDEATSNLDQEMESKLLDTLEQLKSKMTIIAVSHRNSLHRIADDQLRMDTRNESEM